MRKNKTKHSDYISSTPQSFQSNAEILWLVDLAVQASSRAVLKMSTHQSLEAFIKRAGRTKVVFHRNLICWQQNQKAKDSGSIWFSRSLSLALTYQNKWTKHKTLWAPPLTFFTSWHVTAPREIPLAHENLGANELKPRVALVGDDGAMDQVRVGCALPAVGDFGQLRASVVPLHLCLHCVSRTWENQSGEWKHKKYRHLLELTQRWKMFVLGLQ